MFSSRLPANLAPNRIGRAVDGLRRSGEDWIDLTESNPTRVGLAAPERHVRGLAAIAPRVYEPRPLGLTAAREAVAAYLGRGVAPGRVVLTTGTSESYGHLFKLLCDPGDEVLTPRPSYPLFEHLTRLDGVRAVPYALECHGRWSLDLDSVRRGVTGRTRAVVLVNPNNPTGSIASAAEIDALAALCRDHNLALIVDEVFGAYPLAGAGSVWRNSASHRSNAVGASPPAASAPSVLDRQRPALVFSLGGLSKAFGLPQVKLGWIVVDGPPPAVGRALGGLELICDTYLSVAAAPQLAAAALLASGAPLTAAIAERVRRNYAELQRLAGAHAAVDLPPVDGGWYAVLRIPATRPEEEIVLGLIERERVLVHPGYFFDFSHEAHLIVSLLPRPDRFAAGVGRVLASVAPPADC